MGDNLSAALLARLKVGGLKPQCTRDLLEALLNRGAPGALDFARELLPLQIATENERADAMEAARLIWIHGVVGDWSRIWSLIEKDSAFGRQLIERENFNFMHNVGKMVSILTVQDIGHLCGWMIHQYPPQDDPPERRGGGGLVTTAWAMAEIRDALLYYLSELGTRGSHEQLELLEKAFLNFSLISQILRHSKDQMLRNSWRPPSPLELYQLCHNGRIRWVQTSDQLLDVVCDSLQHLQEKLHGEPPAAGFLWDGHQPKDEEALSDWIKIELEEILTKRAIVLGREVQIHRKAKTDIHVDAVALGNRPDEIHLITAIIEVKGCWNVKVKTAMKTQLVEKYLSLGGCTSGIYVVGWFVCAAWWNNDYRRGDVPFKERKEMEVFLEDQAKNLSINQFKIRSIVLDASQPWLPSAPPAK